MEAEDGTVPLDETLRETLQYNGRTYQKHAITNGIYFSPVDEEEIARLELMHSVICQVSDGKLIIPSMDPPKRVLDCGFGAGDWALDVARTFPDCDVIGVDICPNMIPEDRPENVDFQIDDLNARFTFSPGQFDLVHSQMMSGGIDADRWPTYIEDIFHVLRPGGWCQMLEIYFNAQSYNGNLSRVHALSLWSERYLASLDPYKDPRAGLKLNEWMKSTGFTQVERRIIYLPMSPWQIGERNCDVGYVNSENIAQLLHSLALYPFTKLSGIPTNMFEQLVDAARGEAADTSYKAYFPLYITTGRKPVA